MSDQLPPLATPAEVAEYLHTTTGALAQDRYKGTGPKFIKRGSRVLYRWREVLGSRIATRFNVLTNRDSSDERRL
jgi:hypothetical protein